MEEYRRKKINDRLDEIGNRRKMILKSIDQDHNRISEKKEDTLSTNDYLDGMIELCGMYLELKNIEKELMA